MNNVPSRKKGNTKTKNSSKKHKPRNQAKASYHQVWDNIAKQLARPLIKFVFSQRLGTEPIVLEEYDREFDLLEVKKKYVDYLVKLKIKIDNNKYKEFLVHLEFQMKNDNEMIWRMLEYGKEIYRRYKIFPYQVVVYMGDNPLKMENCIQEGVEYSFLNYCFELINLQSYSPEEFLKNEDPGIKLLAAFALKPKDPKTSMVLMEIVKAIFSLNDSQSQKYLLDIIEFLSYQKNVFDEFRKVIKMFEIKIEDLPSFKEGEKKGIITFLMSLIKKKYSINKTQEKELKQLLNTLPKKSLLKLQDVILETTSYEDLISRIK